jgi:hypothetical protein
MQNFTKNDKEFIKIMNKCSVDITLCVCKKFKAGNVKVNGIKNALIMYVLIIILYIDLYFIVFLVQFQQIYVYQFSIFDITSRISNYMRKIFFI